MSAAQSIDKETQANEEATPIRARSRGARSTVHGAVDLEPNIVSALVERPTQLVVQELLKAEQAEFLGGRGR